MRLTVLVVCVAALAACGDDAASPDAAVVDAAPSPECLEAVNHSDLAWIQENVFTPSCSKFNACHKGAALSAGGLNLEDGNSEANMVNQMSNLFPDQTMVIPGDPENSYLMIILGSYPGDIDPDVGTMPFNNPLLCIQKREAIERWITSLANNNADAGVPDAAP